MCWRDNLSNEEWWSLFEQDRRVREAQKSTPSENAEEKKEGWICDNCLDAGPDDLKSHDCEVERSGDDTPEEYAFCACLCNTRCM
jgi:hypothetical protein